MGIFLKLYISINSNGASVDRTAETRVNDVLKPSVIHAKLDEIG